MRTIRMAATLTLTAIFAASSVAGAQQASRFDEGAAERFAGLAAVTGEHYEGGHWLGSFAVYLVTGRGLPGAK